MLKKITYLPVGWQLLIEGLEIQKHLRINKASEMVSSLEGKLVSSLLANEDFIGVLCVGRFQKDRL